MYCSHCGRENPDDNKYCAYCGEKLQTSLSGNEEDIGDGEEGVKKSGKKPFSRAMVGILIILVLVLAALCVSGLLHLFASPSEIEEEESIEEEKSIEEEESTEEEESREEETAETVVETEPEGEDIVYDVNNLSQEQKNMIYPMDVVSYMGVPENIDDTWITVYIMLHDTWYNDFLVDGTGVALRSLEGISVQESFIKEMFSVFCVDFDGTLPAFPETEPTFTLGFYKDGDSYFCGQGDRGMDGAYAIRILSWIQHADGSCIVETTRDWEDWEQDEDSWYPETTYRYELVENEYMKNFTNPLFLYTIVDYEKFDSFILPDADSRYYSASELKSWSQEKLRYARNEIYARHGYIFESLDLKYYFEDQSWYKGTVENEKFDDSVFNEYEKANIDTIKAVEEGDFSFSDIDKTEFSFASGVGAWATSLTVYSDGTFEGIYNDTDAVGSDLEGRERKGVHLHCEFTGKFSDPVRVDEFTYSTKIESLNYKNETGTEEVHTWNNIHTVPEA